VSDVIRTVVECGYLHWVDVEAEKLSKSAFASDIYIHTYICMFVKWMPAPLKWKFHEGRNLYILPIMGSSLPKTVPSIWYVFSKYVKKECMGLVGWLKQ
jgi:hypothetical protein